MSFHPLEQVIGNPLQIPESDIVQPEEPLVFRPQARCIHGFHEALVAQLSLYVFQMQDREQAGMTGPDQDLGRLPACLHVIDSDAGKLQFLIGRVEEQDRNLVLQQPPVQFQVGIGKGAFGRLYDQAVYIALFQKIGQDQPFTADQVVRKGKLGGIPRFRQDTFDSPDSRRENIAVHVSTDDRDVIEFGSPLQADAAADIGAAAADPGQQTFLFQFAGGMADGLPAQSELLAELLLRRQPVSPAQRA